MCRVSKQDFAQCTRSQLHQRGFYTMCPQEELKRDLLQMRQEKERAQAAAAAAAARTQLQHAHSNSSQHHYTTVTSAHKRKREEGREIPTSTKSKKKKMISTTSTKESKKDTKLYCICKTPYDETKYDPLNSNAGQNDYAIFLKKWL